MPRHATTGTPPGASSRRDDSSHRGADSPAREDAGAPAADADWGAGGGAKQAKTTAPPRARGSAGLVPAMSTNQILFGLGLVLVLAVGSQLAARVLGVPGLVVLLPAGFIAGIATDDVHPDHLLGSLYQPFVSIAVGVILFEAGLRLSFGEVAPAVRRAVVRLVVGGTVVTWLAITAIVALLYPDMDTGAAFLVGAILVVSGPTVVLPLLAFI